MTKRLTRLLCLLMALLFVAAPLGGCSRERGLKVTSGEKGRSAYQIAMKKGFDGTLAEWLDEIGSYWEDQEKAAELKELLTLKHELRVREDGSFKVVVFSDVQCSDMTKLVSTGTRDNIKKVVDAEDPDLVLFAGDISYGIDSAYQFRLYVSSMVQYIESKKIPWAHVYGNHDDEINSEGYYSAISKVEQQKIFESFDYCVSKAGDEDLSGIGNYVLPVMTSDGSKIAFNVFGLDSGGYIDPPYKDIVNDGNYFYGKYEGMQKDQTEWYRATSELLEEYNGEKVPAMMYFHIPLQETYYAWKASFGMKENITGSKKENISAPTVNGGLFDAVLERGDVKLIAHGHDHINDFAVDYKGVKLCYTASIGKEVYYDAAMLGGRVVTFSLDDPWNFQTKMSRVK